MAVLLLEKDPFADAVADMSSEQTGFSQANVRRPLWGLIPKEDRFAFISVYRASSEGGSSITPISLLDSSAPIVTDAEDPRGRSTSNHNFILQRVTIQRKEKAQIVETFGDHFVFLYGEKPEFLAVQGMLFNTRDFNWKNEWLANYDQFLRGTKCVENRARVFIGFDDVLIGGYVLGTGVDHAENQPMLCPFNFQMVVTDYHDLSDANDPVKGAEHARTLEGRTDYYPEYLREIAAEPYYVVNELTGEIEIYQNSVFGGTTQLGTSLVSSDADVGALAGYGDASVAMGNALGTGAGTHMAAM